jgi:hypothetical protein
VANPFPMNSIKHFESFQSCQEFGTGTSPGGQPTRISDRKRARDWREMKRKEIRRKFPIARRSTRWRKYERDGNRRFHLISRRRQQA